MLPPLDIVVKIPHWALRAIKIHTMKHKDKIQDETFKVKFSQLEQMLSLIPVKTWMVFCHYNSFIPEFFRDFRFHKVS